MLSLTGDPAEFSTTGHTFSYHHPCRGRDTLEAYDAAYARAAVSDYLRVNMPNLTRFDVNADGRLDAEEVREAIRYTRHNASEMSGRPSDAALRTYASSTCFLQDEADGRKLSDYRDISTGDGLE